MSAGGTPVHAGLELDALVTVSLDQPIRIRPLSRSQYK
jgi:hypothetical protein